ncbi:unnamed protein product [Thlaspi arvense]|uniref:Membrin n=1 Tax=Thlaspi arvense TaxID=13288 RepID=A0AAU9SMR9_THLAR|nr:unnamed protein product [Thlaspi arvense]
MASGTMGGGGGLSEVYSSAKKILLKARYGIERLERFESAPMDSPDLSSSVKRDITEVQSLCSNMDALWRSISVKSQRDLWRRKTEQVGEEAEYLNQSLEKYIAQRKALDVLNTVGLSNSVLRLIERRNRVDTWIKYAGMIATLVILYLFIRWTR